MCLNITHASGRPVFHIIWIYMMSKFTLIFLHKQDVNRFEEPVQDSFSALTLLLSLRPKLYAIFVFLNPIILHFMLILPG